MYAVGGYDGINGLSSVEYFDPSTGQWSVMPFTMNTARYDVGVAVLDARESQSKTGWTRPPLPSYSSRLDDMQHAQGERCDSILRPEKGRGEMPVIYRDHSTFLGDGC